VIRELRESLKTPLLRRSSRRVHTARGTFGERATYGRYAVQPRTSRVPFRRGLRRGYPAVFDISVFCVFVHFIVKWRASRMWDCSE
jgi:hypothetical protein